MSQRFPPGREEKRQALLAAVESVRETVMAGADEAEASATLPAATVTALATSGLFTLKLPAILGGAEADPVTQCEIIEAMTYLDASAGWCTMIGATGIALPAVFLRDEAIAQIFNSGHIPTGAGVLMPTGQAVPVSGGYRLSGRWAFASGIRHAEWMTVGALVPRHGDAPPEHHMVVVPTAAGQIHDNGQVAGLQGTGSCDFSVTELFVPEAFTWELGRTPPQRGGPLYHLGLPGFVANEHAAFALGVGQHALDALCAVVHAKQRGYGRASALATRPAVQRFVGEATLRLRAVRGIIHDIFEAAWTTVCAGQIPSPQQQAAMRSVATFATEAAVDIATRAFRTGGGTALYRASGLQ